MSVGLVAGPSTHVPADFCRRCAGLPDRGAGLCLGQTAAAVRHGDGYLPRQQCRGAVPSARDHSAAPATDLRNVGDGGRGDYPRSRHGPVGCRAVAHPASASARVLAGNHVSQRRQYGHPARHVRLWRGRIGGRGCVLRHHVGAAVQSRHRRLQRTAALARSRRR